MHEITLANGVRIATTDPLNDVLSAFGGVTSTPIIPPSAEVVAAAAKPIRSARKATASTQPAVSSTAKRRARKGDGGTCSICSKAFKKPEGLAWHMEHMHKATPKATSPKATAAASIVRPKDEVQVASGGFACRYDGCNTTPKSTVNARNGHERFKHGAVHEATTTTQPKAAARTTRTARATRAVATPKAKSAPATSPKASGSAVVRQLAAMSSAELTSWLTDQRSTRSPELFRDMCATVARALRSAAAGSPKDLQDRLTAHMGVFTRMAQEAGATV